MQNPNKQLREYYEKLIFDFVFVKSLHEQVKIIYKWDSTGKRKALEIGSFFFQLVLFSFNRTILLETYKLISPKEDKSLIDWLVKAKEHTKSLKPVKYSFELEKSIIIPVSEYHDIIDRQIGEINSKQSIIKIIKGRRDKYLAHSDSTIFNNRQLLDDLYPINDLEIEELLTTVSKIFEEQHLYLNDSAFDVKIHSANKIDTVLKFVRAAARFREDNYITKELKVNVYEYFSDNYKNKKN